MTTKKRVFAAAAGVVAAGAAAAAGVALVGGGASGKVSGAPVPPAASASGCTREGQLPDPVCTPGAANEVVTASNIAGNICVAGWTATVRPPASYTDRLKAEQIAAYGYTDTDPRHYEEDHLIPLALGGNPTSPANLWPQPYADAKVKDRTERRLQLAVCAGQIDLDTARHRIASDWRTAADVLPQGAASGAPSWMGSQAAGDGEGD